MIVIMAVIILIIIVVILISIISYEAALGMPSHRHGQIWPGEGPARHCACPALAKKTLSRRHHPPLVQRPHPPLTQRPATCTVASSAYTAARHLHSGFPPPLVQSPLPPTHDKRPTPDAPAAHCSHLCVPKKQGARGSAIRGTTNRFGGRSAFSKTSRDIWFLIKQNQAKTCRIVNSPAKIAGPRLVRGPRKSPPLRSAALCGSP